MLACGALFAATAVVFSAAVYMVQEQMPTIELAAQQWLSRARGLYRRDRERRQFENEVLFDVYCLPEQTEA